MKIQVQGYVDMRRYTEHLPGNGQLEIADGTTVAQVLEQLGVPGDRHKIILVNGRARSPEYALQDGDFLVFFPPLEGG